VGRCHTLAHLSVRSIFIYVSYQSVISMSLANSSVISIFYIYSSVCYALANSRIGQCITYIYISIHIDINSIRIDLFSLFSHICRSLLHPSYIRKHNLPFIQHMLAFRFHSFIRIDSESIDAHACMHIQFSCTCIHSLSSRMHVACTHIYI